MVNYFIILMLLILLWRQVTLIRKIQIRTKKGRFEIGVFSVAIVSLAALTIFYGKGYMHYLIAIIAGSFLILNWLKQGVSKTGLIIVSKAKEDYLWAEIGSANVRTDDIINIDYSIIFNRFNSI